MRGMMLVTLFGVASLTAETAVQSQPSVPANTILMNPGIVSDTRWHWIEVEANLGGWSIRKGTGSVQIDGRQFHAELSPNPESSGANLSLQGVVQQGSVNATETLLGTDANPTTVLGAVHTQALGGMVEERITFHGGQSGEASYLGLYRLAPRQ
jgi:hypothetical protein